MYSEFAVALFVGQTTFARADAYQRQGRVADVAWSDDRLILTGHVRGSDRLPYTVRVRLRPTGAPELVTGSCDCPVGDRCKHVGAVLLEALRVPAGAPARPAGTAAWRRALDPILSDLEPRDTATALGLQFELQPQQRAAPGRFARSAPREPVYTVAVRPVLLGPKGRWRRTGISWREVLASYAVHDWNPRQLEALRGVHLAVADSSARYSVDSWLLLDRCHGTALWTALAVARREGVALITGGQGQAALVIAEPAEPSVDLARTADGLVLRPAIRTGDGAGVAGPLTLLGEPAIGAATWTLPAGAGPADAVLTLLPFAEPVAAAAHAFLKLTEPIRVPREEEALFLAEHYRRLAALLPVGSADGSFTAPAPPVVALALLLDHGGSAALSGRWEWRYVLPEADGGGTLRLPLEPDGSASFRDAEQERRLLDRVLAAGLASVPAVLHPPTGRPLGRFGLTGMATVAFVRDVLPSLRDVPGLIVEETGTPVDYRAATQAPVVSVGTAARQGDRDWFDLEIEVKVGDEAVPLADVFRALSAGEEFLVLPGGLYFPLEGAVFARLRELIAEARELGDQSVDDLRISRFQSSLWDDLVELGVVTRQAEAWRRSVASLTGFSSSGEVERQPVPGLLSANLRPYQQAGYDWLSFLYDNGLGGVLADDMGLGKTVQALALVARALSGAGRQEGRPRFLVIAPTSVVPNWAAEAHRFVPSARVVAVTETARKRGRPLAETIADADLVITSYALARLDADAYAGLDWSGLLLDEAQFVKNRASATYARIRGLGVPFTLAITGTPLENSLMDLWSMLSLAAPGLFPSPTGFAEYYQRPIERDGDAERLAQLRRRIRPVMLRRTKEVVADDLPPKLEQILEVELAPKQRAVYDRYLARERSRVLGLMGEFDKNRFAIFRALTTLRQAALHAALVDPAYEGVPSSKLDLLDELLADALAEGHRVLVFSQFTRLLARVRHRLDGADIGYAYLDGATVRRAAAIDRFRSGEADVFLISLKAGGFGLNLAEADYCVLLDPWWNPAVEAQAVDRAHRIGQTRSVFVYRLVAKDTIEEKVMALKTAKAELFDAVMSDAEGAAGAGITADDVRELLG